MKKLIIGVIAIVLLLGVNFASAMKVLPPLAIAEPLNAFEQQIWNDIQILQNQISNLAQRLAVVERKPTTPTLKVYDGNNQFIGYYAGGAVASPNTYYMNIFMPDSSTIVYTSSNGELSREPYKAILYEGPDCTGAKFSDEFNYGQLAVWGDINHNNQPIIIVPTGDVMNNKDYVSYWFRGTCYRNPGTTNNARYFNVFDMQNFAGPLEIRVE